MEGIFPEPEIADYFEGVGNSRIHNAVFPYSEHIGVLDSSNFWERTKCWGENLAFVFLKREWGDIA